MTPLILVEGTWGGAWAEAGSDLRLFLAAEGFEVIRFRGWSGDLNGALPSLTDLFRGRDARHSDWRAGGHALGYLLQLYPGAPILCHSHGLNAVLYQCAEVGEPVTELLSICSPARKDMEAIALQARPRIGYWRHVSAKGWDVWQRTGELFDGHWGWRRTWTQADTNVLEPGIGHTGLLADPARFPTLRAHLDVLRGGVHGRA